MEKEKVTDISVIILTKNEAGMIEDCIKSVESLKPREIVVIDDNSTDATIEKARKLGTHVFVHEKKNFAEARNFGLTKVSGKWVLYIDADEQVTRELSQEIREIISSQLNPVAYEILRVNFYLGRRWPYTEKLARLFKKTAIQNWYGEVHESPRVDGEVGRLTQPLIHYTHRNLSEMVENTLVWSKIEAKLRFDAHHPPVSWWRIPRVMLPTFLDYYIRQGGWKVGTVGLIESIYQAFSIFITYARLWEMQNNSKLKIKN